MGRLVAFWIFNIILITVVLTNANNVFDANISLEDILYDIYQQLNEEGEISYEDLQEQLMEKVYSPINLNKATEEDLQHLLFLNSHQIDAILLYVYHHPMESVYELRLIPALPDYIIRDMLPFVTVEESDEPNKIYFREVFRHAKHEILVQAKDNACEEAIVDNLNSQIKYKFNYNNRVRFGAVVRQERKTVLHGEYIQLNDIRFLKNVVLGHYRASTGIGLVLGDNFNFKNRSQPLNVGKIDNRWSHYNSSTMSYMHGAAASFAFKTKDIFWQISALYSITKPNDTLKLHTVGANVTLTHKHLQIGITTIENIYTDSVQYYFKNALYNQNYFHGTNQNVVGLTFRYNFGKVDLFGELAGCQNQSMYGFAGIAGIRYYPRDYLGMVAMYRRYSPYYHNLWAHCFSQTSQINDEEGVYLGGEFNYFRRWHTSLYADFYRFSGYKYRINYFPSYHFDIQWNHSWFANKNWVIKNHLRCKAKTGRYYYSTNLRVEWIKAGWTLRFIGDVTANDSSSQNKIGYSLIQDLQYAFTQSPIVVHVRFQYFNTPIWDNRIYNYENDILYSFSSTFAYGEGWRTYINLRVKLFPWWSLYFRIRETIYAKKWSERQSLDHQTKTDIHLLMRFSL